MVGPTGRVFCSAGDLSAGAVVPDAAAMRRSKWLSNPAGAHRTRVRAGCPLRLAKVCGCRGAPR